MLFPSFGTLAGLAVGYVLGTKAGQERYEQIRQQAQKLMGTEPAQNLQAELNYAKERAVSVVEEKANAGVSKVSGMVHKGGQSAGGSDTSGSDLSTTGLSTGTAGMEDPLAPLPPLEDDSSTTSPSTLPPV